MDVPRYRGRDPAPPDSNTPPPAGCDLICTGSAREREYLSPTDKGVGILPWQQLSRQTAIGSMYRFCRSVRISTSTHCARPHKYTLASLLG